MNEIFSFFFMVGLLAAIAFLALVALYFVAWIILSIRALVEANRTYEP